MIEFTVCSRIISLGKSCPINFKSLKIISDMYFKTPIQVYIEQNVNNTTIRTRDKEKNFSKKY